MPEISTTVSSKIYYQKVGQGPTLILLHGFPESSSLWRHVTSELAQSFTVILPDFPGSGNSVLEHETSIPEMADCVAAILDNENASEAVIAGHSMGGYVGFAFAAKYPHRVAGLSLVHSTPLADDEEKIKNRLKVIELIEKGGKSAFIRQMVPGLFSASFKASHPDAVEEQIDLALQLEDKSLVNYYRAMIARTDHSELLKTATYPVQWIMGIDDNVIFYKKLLEQCTKSGINFVTFYSNCGHMSMLEAPGKLISDLTEFANYCCQPAATI